MEWMDGSVKMSSFPFCLFSVIGINDKGFLGTRRKRKGGGRRRRRTTTTKDGTQTKPNKP